MAMEIEHRPEATRQRLKPPPLYRVVLLNDDFTPMDFVTELLCSLFHKPRDEAERIMLQIHHQGRGVGGVYPLDVAETKQYQALSISRRAGHPLRCVVEPERSA
ncbi:MAG: ATP-dependent Clp protease adapter ClpS [Zetaproteobacteria bacterium]|nr:MAG: ATP-dependent Clp protease adapter ClpS [Zetaproteobacteria bacterium]